MFDPWRLYRKPRCYASILFNTNQGSKTKHRGKMDATDSASFGAYQAFQKEKEYQTTVTEQMRADEADGVAGAARADEADGVAGADVSDGTDDGNR